MLYGIDINYYFRINFSGFQELIDALGGITVNSDVEFDAGGYHFDQGANTVNGEQALAFCPGEKILLPAATAREDRTRWR